MDIQSFEKELVTKLQYKASSRVGVDTVLLKIFKFFDLNNEGFLKRSEFFKAIAKSGVTIAEEQLFDTLWEHYSEGEIVYYKDFIQQVVSKQSGMSNDMAQYQAQYDPKIQHLSSQGISNQPNQVINILKSEFALRGSLGLLNFATSLPNQFNCQQFQDCLRKQGIELEQAYQLFTSEYVGMSHLINQIKGPFLNQFRQALLSNVYYSLEQGPMGVTPQYLSTKYHAERHPDIKHLNKSPMEIREEFYAGLSGFTQLKGINQFSITDFFEFYSFIGFHIQNDELFRNIISQVWDMDQQNSPQSVNKYAQQPQSPESNKSQIQQQQSRNQPPMSVQSRGSVPRSVQSQAQSQSSQLSATTKQVELVVSRIRNRLVSRGARGFIQLYRVFKILDVDHDGLLNLSEFRRAIRDHRIEVTDPEIDLVFQYFDRDASGNIDLWGFMYVLRGEMSEARVLIVDQLFDKYAQGEYVTLSVLKNNFTVRNHPELRSGKKADDEIIADFFEPLILLHNINGGFGHENISREQLMEFFSNYSASIQEDKYFEQIIGSVFRLQLDQPKQHHAGGKQVFEPDHKKGYLQDHHRYLISGGSVSANAPFGTFSQQNEPQQLSQQRPQTAYVQPQSFNIFKPLEDQQSVKLSESQISQVSQSNKLQAQQPLQPQQQPQTPSQTHYQIDQTPKSKKVDSQQILKNKILVRGIRGLIGIQSRFQLNDKAHLGQLSYNEWQAAFRQWRLDVNDTILQDVFNQHKSNGMILYDSFIKQIQGTMTLRKFNAVQQVFESFNQLTVSGIIGKYVSKEHPDVKFNRRREDDVLCEFIDTFEQHHNVFVGSDYVKNPNVSFEEFISYNNNISTLIEDEVQFESLLHATWGLRRR